MHTARNVEKPFHNHKECQSTRNALRSWNLQSKNSPLLPASSIPEQSYDARVLLRFGGLLALLVGALIPVVGVLGIMEFYTRITHTGNWSTTTAIGIAAVALVAAYAGLLALCPVLLKSGWKLLTGRY